MEQEIIGGKIGSVGDYNVEFKDGKLVASGDIAKVVAPGVELKGQVSVEIGASAVLEALKKAIPGTLDDMAFDLIEKALGV